MIKSNGWKPAEWKIGSKVTILGKMGITGPHGGEVTQDTQAIIDGMIKREDNSWLVSLKFKNGKTMNYIVPDSDIFEGLKD